MEVDYPFTDLATGEPVSLPFECGEGPDIGDVLELDGKLYRREAVRGSCDMQIGVGPRFPFTVHSQHQDAKGIRHRDAAGAAVMTSADDVRHYAKANRLSYDWGCKGAR